MDQQGVVPVLAEGKKITLNVGLGKAELERRLSKYHHSFHGAIDRSVGERPGAAVVAVHSFTPEMDGKKREMEIGILFDKEEELAEIAAASLRDAGLTVALNAPYSGREGMIYTVVRHAGAHGRRGLEYEIRQDIATDKALRTDVVECLTASIKAVLAAI